MVRKATTSSYRGAAGREKADRERTRLAALKDMRKNQVREPFRFYMKEGETKQGIIVDDEPDFFRYEHAMQNPRTKRYDMYTGCVMETDNCPACESSGKEPYYALYFTLIDLTPFTTKDGTTVEFSRKLLVVKPAQQKKFQRMYEKAEAKGHGLRGALVEFNRDGEMSASIGNDISLLEYVDEEEMATYVRSWTDKDGKKHTENCAEVFDYEAIFPEQDAEQLRALVGGDPVPGSESHERATLGRTRRTVKTEDDEDDDEGWEAPEKTSRMKTKPKTRARPAVEEEDEEESAPSSRRSRATTGAASRARKKPVIEEDDEDDDEDVEETVTIRSSRVGKSPARPTLRRAAVQHEDDEEEDDDDDDDEAADEEVAPRRAVVKKPTTTRRGRAEEPDEDDEDVPETTNKRNPRRVTMRKGK